MLLLRHLLCLAAALAAALGEMQYSQSKVVAGVEIPIGNVPFMVQVVTVLQPDDNAFCGGSLISVNHVLTAGHCLQGQVSDMRVYVGTAEIALIFPPPTVYSVKSGRAHPKYKKLKWSGGSYTIYDVAVLRLQSSVKLSSKVATIALTKPNQAPKPGSQVTVSGWGVAEVNRPTLSRLRAASLTVLTAAACKSVIKETLIPQEFCTQASSKGAFCSGDSGGPAYNGRTQYGVVSWGNCGKGYPAVFANLADPALNSFVKQMVNTL